MDEKDQIKRSVSITDVVSMYVDLKPSGKYLKALCPFHTEKTPSFFVMPDKDTFSCFGCNKFGDIFTFIQEIENLGFHEAMNFLIDRFNIPIDRKKNNNQLFKKERYEEINALAQKYFMTNLYDSKEGKSALAYLEKRGITENTMTQFALGYAQNRWDGLYNYLVKKGADIEKAIELGLVVKHDSNRVYDRFRGRVMFPIFPGSASNSPIAFGGRTLFDDPSKYLNSPDTPLYKKSHHLYAFHLAKETIREKKIAILVEGYFDAISLYQHGVKNVAASLGTALSEQQIYLLKRFSKSIYIFYDSDKAGINAAVRGIEKMFEQDINPWIITMSQCKDPDDFIREHGLNAFYRLIEQAIDGFRFLVRTISQAYNPAIPEQKNAAVQAVMAYVLKINEPIIRDEYIRMTSDFFKVDEKLLKNQNPRSKTNPALSNPGQQPQGLSITLAEQKFLEAILACPNLIEDIQGVFAQGLYQSKILNGLPSRNIILTLFKNYSNMPNNFDDYKELIKPLSEAEIAGFRHIFDLSRSVKHQREELENQVLDSLKTFQEMYNKNYLRKLDQELKIAEQQKNYTRVQELLQEKFKFVKSRHDKKESIQNITGKNPIDNTNNLNLNHATHQKSNVNAIEV